MASPIEELTWRLFVTAIEMDENGNVIRLEFAGAVRAEAVLEFLKALKAQRTIQSIGDDGVIDIPVGSE